MKIRFKNKLHNCDNHLIKYNWHEEGYIVETIEYCSICGRIKNHDSYGADCVINYKPKKFYRLFESKGNKNDKKENQRYYY